MVRSFWIRSISALNASLLCLLPALSGATTAASGAILPHVSGERPRSPHDKYALYILTGGGLLTEYDFAGLLIGQQQLSDTNATAMCSNGRDRLYVIDNVVDGYYGTQKVQTFVVGSRKPMLKFTVDTRHGWWSAFQCAPDPSSDGLALFGYCPATGAAGVVAEYHAKHRQPWYLNYLEAGSGPFWAYAGTVSPSGNVWVGGTEAVFPEVGSRNGGWYFESVPRNYDHGFIYGLGFDAQGHVLLEDAHARSIDIYPPNFFGANARQRGAIQSLGTVPLNGTGAPRYFVLTPEQDALFTLDGGNVDGFKYPTGGNPFTVIQAGAVGFGIAKRRTI